MASRPCMLTAALLLTVAACDQDTDAPAAPSATPDIAAVTTQPIPFRQITEGWDFACGVTTTDIAYCWGGNGIGQLGNGVRGDGGTAIPTPVFGGLRFRHVSTGAGYACGVTTSSQVYCWGTNYEGQIGDSTYTYRSRPTKVLGNRQYLQVRAGSVTTCALTTAGAAYCWGYNNLGQLGIGSTISQRPYPVKVSGGLTFVELSTQAQHVCGRTAAGKLYCWGQNSDGQLGDGTTTNRFSPKAVAGTRLYRTISAAGGHTCAIGMDDRAYCWGHNEDGELGDNTFTPHHTPTAVTGGLLFAGVSAGAYHTCGVTQGSIAYCWGAGTFGQLGIGDFSTKQPAPTKVAQSLTWLGVTAGPRNSCGVTRGTNKVAYCWGRGSEGQLGYGLYVTLPFAWVPVGGGPQLPIP